jgi:hypothetical protein
MRTRPLRTRQTTDTDSATPEPAPLAYSVNAFVKASNGSCGRTKVYELIRAGRLKAKHLDGRTLIPADSAKGFIDALPDFHTTAQAA